MSATFTGFSEDDIRKVQGDMTSSKNLDEKEMGLKKLPATNKKSILKNTIKSKETRNKKIINKTVTIQDIPEEAKLNVKEPLIVQEKPVEVIQKETSVEKKHLDLKEFEVKQKEIEEQNKRRKELLSKALAARTKQTQEEARKLQEIQNEFKKLDADLSNDVKILRHQIELASVDYMEAHKKYIKAEREFLETKMLLHQRQERKEMLTEHLCAIIEKNEERKATKLTELLNKLELEDAQNGIVLFSSEQNENKENSV